MRLEIAEATWTDDAGPLSLEELAERSGLSRSELEWLVECEALLPLPGSVPSDPAGPQFDMACLELARKACRLRADFSLDATGLALVLQLLGRVRELEDELRALEARLPRHWS